MVKLPINNNRPDGRRYEGAWVNGKQSGAGSYRDVKGTVVKAEWIEGKMVPGTMQPMIDGAVNADGVMKAN